MRTIEFNHVWEKYRIKFIRDKKVSWEEIWVLKDIIFQVEQGTVLGIIGQNGAGKTTLLKLIAGMLMPDKGEIHVQGKVSALMELGAGFNPEFTGRENIMLNARIYGIEEKMLHEQMEKIVSFADLGKFIDAPIKYYSLGMSMRLAFSLAVFVNPDVLLIDDILVVGDKEAQLKCGKKIRELKSEGKTLVVVSHDMEKIRRLCDRVIFLDEGNIIREGDPDEAISYYLQTVGKKRQERFLLGKTDTEAWRMQQTITAGNLSLFVDDEHKRIRLYNKEKEITADRGLFSVFHTPQKRFRADEAQWTIQEISKKELILTLEFESLLLTQIWRLSFAQENTLDIKIEMNLSIPLILTSQDIRLEFQDIYHEWKTTSEDGFFSSNQSFDHIYPIRWKNNKVCSVLLKTEDKLSYPDLFFACFSHRGARIMSLHKRKEKDAEYICLNSSLIVPKKEELKKAGRYVYFEGKISLGGDVQFEECAYGEIAELKENLLSFVFDNGKGRIFVGPKELTTGLSVFTSVRSSGIWLDSYQAFWHIEEKDDKKIIAVGHWPHLPISQRWQIELNEKNLISWEIESQIYDEVNLEIEQANVMLSSAFKSWRTTDSSQGDFLEEYTQDYDILPFRFWYGQAERLEAIGDSLPKIVFRRERGYTFLKGIVENTDSLYRARLLQYQKTNTEKQSPRKYSFFKGVIEIGP